MANCNICGRRYGLFEGYNGKCNVCITRNSTPESIELERKYQAEADRKAHEAQETEARHKATLASRAQEVMLTTESAPSGLIITDRVGIVTAECAFGMHLFKDVFTATRDLFGGRSETIQNTLKDARNTALQELRTEAAYMGADAVIAVDLDYSEFSGGGKSMLFLVASGTAVKIGKPTG